MKIKAAFAVIILAVLLLCGCTPAASSPVSTPVESIVTSSSSESHAVSSLPPISPLDPASRPTVKWSEGADKLRLGGCGQSARSVALCMSQSISGEDSPADGFFTSAGSIEQCYRMLGDGEVDIIIVPKVPTLIEELRQAGVRTQERLIGRDAVGFVSKDGGELTSDEIMRMFFGEIKPEGLEPAYQADGSDYARLLNAEKDGFSDYVIKCADSPAFEEGRIWPVSVGSAKVSEAGLNGEFCRVDGANVNRADIVGGRYPFTVDYYAVCRADNAAALAAAEILAGEEGQNGVVALSFIPTVGGEFIGTTRNAPIEDW